MAGAGDDPHEHDPDPFAALLDRARGAEEVASRSRARWIRRQAEESASLLGTFVDLAEAGTPVVVRTTSGRRHQGRVTAVGADFFVIAAAPSGRAAAVATAGVAWVRPQGAGEHPVGPATGDRPPALDVRLVELLADAAHDRPRVMVAVLGDPDPLVGELRAVGVDVITLAIDGGARPGALHYVPVGSVTEVAFTSG